MPVEEFAPIGIGGWGSNQDHGPAARANTPEQPEVSRLLRFHGTTPLARRLRAARPEVLRLVHDAGGEQVRVFGSVARVDDVEGSDVDLLFVMRRPLSLMELGRLEEEVAAAVGVAVDLVPESSLRPALRVRALAESVPL